MDSRGSVGFSVKLCAFFQQQSRFLGHHVRDGFGLPASEFTMLYALYEVEDPIPIEALARFLMLKTRTVRKSLLALEDRGLVEKSCDERDRRTALCRLTPSGRCLTREAVESWFAAHELLTQRYLPSSDLEQTLRPSMRVCVNRIRGCEVAPFGTEPKTTLAPMAVDHPIFWRAMTDAWTGMVHEGCGLSLNELCVLLSLEERGAQTPTQLATAMLQPLSAVSLCKKSLVDKGLAEVAECGLDGRITPLACTREGARVARRVGGKLDDFTAWAHGCATEEQMEVIVAWYSRMFINVWRSGH